MLSGTVVAAAKAIVAAHFGGEAVPEASIARFGGFDEERLSLVASEGV
jgi:hypothetical protein